MADDRVVSTMVGGIRADFDAAVTTWLSFDDPNNSKTEINEVFNAMGLHIGEERDAAIAVGARMCSSLLQAFAATVGRDPAAFWQEILLDAALSDAEDAAAERDQEE